MQRSRIWTFLGPTVVLYLLADAATHGVLWTARALLPALLLLAAAGLPFLLDERGEGRGRLYALAHGLAWWIGGSLGQVSLVAELAAAVGASLAGTACVLFALDVPDVPPALLGAGRGWGRFLRVLWVLAGVTVCGAGAAAALPMTSVAGMPLLLGGRFAVLPSHYLLAAFAFAFGARALRRRLGSPVEVLAANAWAMIGLGAGVALGLLAVIDPAPLHAIAPSVAAVLAAAVVLAHHLLVDPLRRWTGPAAVRRVLAAAGTFGALAAAAMVTRPAWPEEPWAFAALAVLAGFVTLGAFRAATALAWQLAPFRGRLLDAAVRAQRSLDRAADALEAARVVLAELRRGAGDPRAQPLLYVLEPPRVLWIDAAGEPRVRTATVPPALLEPLTSRPSELCLRRTLERHIVRRPELRALVEVLVELDAACVVPLARGDDLEGALVVPRGRRRSALTLEEIIALRALAARTTGHLAAWSAQLRAQARLAAAAEREATLTGELARLSRENGRLRDRLAHTGAEAAALAEIAYGPPSRAFAEQCRALAAARRAACVTLEAGLEPVLLALASPRRGTEPGGPLVTVDAAAVRGEGLEATLFGSRVDTAPPRGGAVDAARGGTLLLLNLPAVPVAVQARLAEALAGAAGTDAASGEDRPARLVASTRVPLPELLAAGVVHPALGRLLRVRLRAPALRERPEDLPSLVLLCLDRATRMLGRGPIGVAPEALARLVEHSWPGNLDELAAVIERAVSFAQDRTLTAADVRAALAGGAAAARADEARLARALATTGGGVVDAAREIRRARAEVRREAQRAERTGPSEPSSSVE